LNSNIDKALSIGGLSKLTGCNIETIRYYEKINLLPAPHRSEGGHRMYPSNLQSKLVFIRKARNLGFTLKEVRNLLDLISGDYTCDEVKQVVVEHIDVVTTKIKELTQMRNNLKVMASQCLGGSFTDCSAIDSLFDRA
jgi:MerR family mercuric resistance operon transcriptional regulator